jgi:hypothetical protein
MAGMADPPAGRVPFWRERLGLAACWCLYLASFGLPVVEGEKGEVLYGYQSFLWLLRELELWVYWTPNLIFWIGSWLAFRRRWAPAAMYGAGNAVLLVHLFFGWWKLFGPGFYCWAGSMVLFAVWSVVRCIKSEWSAVPAKGSIKGSILVLGIIFFVLVSVLLRLALR